MTLIAAFRCYEGAVLCADTMESAEDFRTPVHKLEAVDCGGYWLAIAGSGNSDLVDGFVYRLRQHVSGWKAGLGDTVIGEQLRDALMEFYGAEVALYPTSEPSDNRCAFIACIKPKDRVGLSLWELRGTVVVPVTDYSLLGIGATLYKHELKTLFNVNNSIATGTRFGKIRALLLGIHLFNLAKDTSTWIGGATDAIFVFDEGDMKPVDPDDVRLLEERVGRFDATIAGIVLACPDTTVQDAELESYLDIFTQNIMKMREQFALQAADFTSRAILSNAFTEIDPYLHIPSDRAIQLHFNTNSVTIEPRDENNPSPFKRKKPGRAKRIVKQDEE